MKGSDNRIHRLQHLGELRMGYKSCHNLYRPTIVIFCLNLCTLLVLKPVCWSVKRQQCWPLAGMLAYSTTGGGILSHLLKKFTLVAIGDLRSAMAWVNSKDDLFWASTFRISSIHPCFSYWLLSQPLYQSVYRSASK